jgi:hypothetical protein
VGKRTDGTKITGEGFVISNRVSDWVVATLRDRAGDADWRRDKAMGLEIFVPQSRVCGTVMRVCGGGCDVGVGDALTVFGHCAVRWCGGKTGGIGEVCVLFFVHFYGSLDGL